MPPWRSSASDGGQEYLPGPGEGVFPGPFRTPRAHWTRCGIQDPHIGLHPSPGSTGRLKTQEKQKTSPPDVVFLPRLLATCLPHISGKTGKILGRSRQSLRRRDPLARPISWVLEGQAREGSSRIENPCVPGSTPGYPTTLHQVLAVLEFPFRKA